MTYTVVVRDQDRSQEVLDVITKKVKLDRDDKNPDIVIAIGGDGTILKAFHLYPKSLLFGIKTGTLGFYSNYLGTDLDKMIDDINNQTYSVSELDLLKIAFIDKDGNKKEDIALNEITVVSPLRTLRLDVYVDELYLERFRGTGVCVSTPSGSTAYNKSLHGAVIDSDLSVMQLTEIAGINSNAYRTLSSPLILSNERTILLKAVDFDKTFITVDNKQYSVENLNAVRISINEDKLRMAYHDYESFYKRLQRTFLISLK